MEKEIKRPFKIIERPDPETTDAAFDRLERRARETSGRSFTLKEVVSSLREEGRAVESPAVSRALQAGWIVGKLRKYDDYPAERYQWGKDAPAPRLVPSRNLLEHTVAEVFAVFRRYDEPRSWFNIVDALNGELRGRVYPLLFPLEDIKAALDAAWIAGLVEWKSNGRLAVYRLLERRR